jgi:hypothetical protein
MNWRAGSKVFETEDEARQYAKDMMSLGALVGISETAEEVTHQYVFGNFGRTMEV